MKELTMNEKMALLDEANKLLATIPDYKLKMPVREIEYSKIFITNKGYILHILLEYGEATDVFLGKTYGEAIKGLAHEWIVSYVHLNFHLIYLNEKNLSPLDGIERFYAHCNSFINRV